MTFFRPDVCKHPSARLVLLGVLLAGAATAVQAQQTNYPSRATFNAAAPGSTLVDFEAGDMGDPANIPSGNVFNGPLSSTTDNAIFSAGDIPAGITFSSSCGVNDSLLFAGAGFDAFGWSGTGGFPSKVLLPGSDACSLSMVFAQPVDAVALDVFAESDSGFRVLVFGAGDALLQTIDGTAGETVPGFFGVVSQQPITRIEMKAPSGTASGNFEAADNVAFRAYVAGSGSATVPVLGPESLLVFSLLTAAAAIFVIRRALA